VAHDIEWTKETYSETVTSDCWWFTPYDKDDPGYWDAISKDAEMRDIVAMEAALPDVPEWARDVGIDLVPPCGPYNFPEPFLQVLSLIGSADPAVISKTFKLKCYAVDPARKRQAQDYCLCLDAWLAGADPSAPAAELNALSPRTIDWSAVCTDLWGLLGDRSEKKELQVELVLGAIRHAIKVSRWTDDPGTVFGRDQFLGAYKEWPDFVDYGVYIRSARAQRLVARLKQLDPEWAWETMSRVDCGTWWLCAPKAFRFLEYDLWAIAKDRPAGPDDDVPGFLRCEDTYPNQDEAAVWFRQFCDALDTWWQGHDPTGQVGDMVSARLGDPSPVKQWLVRLFLKKLKMYESTSGILKSLVNPGPDRKRGTRTMVTG